MNQKIHRKARRNTKAPMFLLLAMILIVIGIIATFFSFFVADDLKADTQSSPFNPPAGVSTSSGGTSSVVTSSDNSSGQLSSGEQEGSQTDSSDTSSEPAPPQVKVSPLDFGRVPETESVDRAYFDDAIFIGDSISKGLKLYGVLPATNVLADQNVGLDQVAGDKEVYYNAAGEKKSLFTALNAMNVTKNKIYILLGSNGLPHYGNEAHIKYYETVLDRIIEKYPDATIYLQSVTPITKAAEASYAKRKKDFTNVKINEFNTMVEQLAEKKGVYYLNVRDSLIDENGYLSASFAGSDGVHFVKSGHEAMYRYYKTHVVQDGMVTEKAPE